MSQNARNDFKDWRKGNDEKLLNLVYDNFTFEQIAALLNETYGVTFFTAVECNERLAILKLPNKRKFLKAEDNQLSNLVKTHGTNNWTLIASEMITRTARECKDRWENYLNPVLPTQWTQEEDETIEFIYKQIGARWEFYPNYLPNKTISQIKNRYAVLKKRMNTESITDQETEEKESVLNTLIPAAQEKEKLNQQVESESSANANGKKKLPPISEFFDAL